MATYILSKTTARQMCDMWFALGLCLSDVEKIHDAFGIFTVFDASGLAAVKCLRELNVCDEVRLYVTPGPGEDDQEKIVRYGNILCAIVSIASGLKATCFGRKPKFVIIYE